MIDKQPQTNDYRKRIARPLYVQTFANQGYGHADTQANDFADLVSDQGGEVTTVNVYLERDTTGDYPYTMHYRVVTYRASSRIEPAYPLRTYTGDDDE